jgi:two-component system phosphate regulon sensor histidine kinase PhoR
MSVAHSSLAWVFAPDDNNWLDMRSFTILLYLSILAICLAVWGAIVSQASVWAALLIPCLGLIAGYVNKCRNDSERLSIEANRQERRADTLEREIRRQREVVDALADGLEIGIFLCDSKTMIEYANQTASDLFKFPDPRRRNMLAVTLSHDLESMINMALSTRVAQRGEVVLRYPEERIGLAKAWLDPVSDDRVFVTVQDITSLRRLERVRRDFVANVSHELRTPLTTIRAMAETLLDTPDEEMHEYKSRFLPKVISEVDRLNMITDDLLTLSAAESKPVEKKAMDLAALVRECLEDFHVKAESKGLELKVETPARVTALINPHQITQVISNLIDNAIKYSNQGEIQVTLLLEDEEAILSVKDNGIGIAEEHHRRVFERFYRVDKGRSRATGGTGLGLSIVKHIVEAHGGRIEVESQEGMGSTFRLYLPVH